MATTWKKRVQLTVSTTLGVGMALAALGLGRTSVPGGPPPALSSEIHYQGTTYQGTTYQGTVVLVDKHQLVLNMQNERQRFVVPPGTMIIVNSAEADLEAISPGYYATITATNAGRELVASFIDASRQFCSGDRIASCRSAACEHATAQ